ncbi:MAG TPA: hypothetical protein DCZ94_08880 [Lentisphaeria bacterium]|nr:MAG: hypothetical protein A2X48_23520 [Lentisphaerae bacterium GWF2_49_21]HBC87054.1 hypothetical protein [Lentisphaeria bacterium]
MKSGGQDSFNLIIPLFAFLLLLPASAYPAPTISVEGNSQADLGTFETRESKGTSFKITNKGNEILKIGKIQTTCKCSKLDISSKEIAPGASAVLEVETTPYTLEGKFTRSIYIETNDPANKFVQLSIVGNATTLANVEPGKLVYAGKLSPGQLWRNTFVIKGADSRKLSLGQPFVESNQPARAILKGVSDTEFQIAVEVQIGPEYDSMKTLIKVPVIQPAGWSEIEIRAAGQVVKDTEKKETDLKKK